MKSSRPAATLVAALLATTLFAPSSAQAEWRPSGAASATVLVRDGDRDIGGSVLVDFWHPVGPLRVGGVLGVAALTSELTDDDGRAFAPLGLSLALVKHPEPVGISLRARGGLWAGAIPGTLAAGGWLTVGAHVEFALDPAVALSIGMDAWFLFGHGDTTLFAPTLSLVWNLDRVQ